MTYGQIVTNALSKIGAIGVGETPSSADMQAGLLELRLILNDWNAEHWAVYADAFATYTLVPDLSPHTIGPTGATWTASQRPVSLTSAQLILTNQSPSNYTQIEVRDAQWWALQPTPGLTSTFPTDVYYQPDWPNGKLFFWPVPQGSYQVQIQIRVLLDDTISASNTFTLPPAYENALTLTTAENCCLPFSKQLPPQLAFAARQARARVFANNDVTPSLGTSDWGMTPGPAGTRADFNFLTGLITSR